MDKRLLTAAVLATLLLGACTDDDQGGSTTSPSDSPAASASASASASPTAAPQPGLTLTGDISATSTEVVAHGGKPVASGPACTVSESRFILDVGFRAGPTTYYLKVDAHPYEEHNYFEFPSNSVSVSLGTAHGRAELTDTDKAGSGVVTTTGSTVVVDGELQGGGKVVRIVATVICPELF